MRRSIEVKKEDEEHGCKRKNNNTPYALVISLRVFKKRKLARRRSGKEACAKNIYTMVGLGRMLVVGGGKIR